MNGIESVLSPNPGQYLETEAVGRDLGIPAVGAVPWGSHLCQFFDTKQDLLDSLVPYFRAGIENNETCVWVSSDLLGVEEASEALGREVDDFERRVASGQVLVVPHFVWYGDPKDIDPDHYLKIWLPRIKKSLTQGFTGLRVSGNATWVEASDWQPTLDYESAFGQQYHNQRILALCNYPLDKCDIPMMVDVLLRHRFTLVRRGDWTLIEPSEQKKATAAVERMNQALTERTAELQAALSDLRGFSRWVTHDLRAPLRSVRGFSSLLWPRRSCPRWTTTNARCSNGFRPAQTGWRS